jgi:hypothetical protein
MPTLLLVDGSSYLYRAFHAMPDLRTTRSEPTGALHGVLNMLRRLESDYQARTSPTRPASSTPRARPSATTGIRNTRPIGRRCPTTWCRRSSPCTPPSRALGWPLLMRRRRRSRRRDRHAGAAGDGAGHRRCVVSTGDKDLAQLVGPQVQLVNTMSNEVLDEAGVLAKFGVPPARIVDYLALVGDTVDNVPGVDKVGAEDRRQVAASMARSTASSSPMPPRSAAPSARTCAAPRLPAAGAALVTVAATSSCRCRGRTGAARADRERLPSCSHTTKCARGCGKSRAKAPAAAGRSRQKPQQRRAATP